MYGQGWLVEGLACFFVLTVAGRIKKDGLWREQGEVESEIFVEDGMLHVLVSLGKSL